jgi:hypothetical protein
MAKVAPSKTPVSETMVNVRDIMAGFESPSARLEAPRLSGQLPVFGLRPTLDVAYALGCRRVLVNDAATRAGSARLPVFLEVSAGGAR